MESGVRSSNSSSAATAANKKASNMAQVKDGPGVIKVEGETYFIYRLQMVVESYGFFPLFVNIYFLLIRESASLKFGIRLPTNHLF